MLRAAGRRWREAARAHQRRQLSGVADGPVAAELADRRVLRLAGDDLEHFLQGLMTNDARLLSQGRLVYTTFLSSQGRVLFDALLHPQQRAGDAPVVLLETDATTAPELSAHLRKYRLRAKVDIADASADFAVWGTLGAVAAGEGRWRPDPRLDALGLRAVLPRAEAAPPAGMAKAEDAAAAVAAMRRRRLLLGVAEGSAEMAGELPLELNIEALNGVSFSKGCYIGQELTARTHFRGVIRKRVMPVRLIGSSALEHGAAVAPARGEGDPSGTGQGERGAGRVLASDRDVVRGDVLVCFREEGIALLRLADALQPSARLETHGRDGSRAGAGALEVHVPEWWPPQWVEAVVGARSGGEGRAASAEEEGGSSSGGDRQTRAAAVAFAARGDVGGGSSEDGGGGGRGSAGAST